MIVLFGIIQAQFERFSYILSEPDLRLALTIHRTLLGDMIPGSLSFSSLVIECRGGLFPFPTRSLPFLTVNATIGNQAFSHDGCNIFPGLSYNKANDTFLNSVRTNDVEAQVEFPLKVKERARVTCY